ncbi:MAG: hypothetical protein RMM16_12225, partial [Chloroherpetonaceae bacterium]|nr:hypothetical protein [Chloroherpetonaceae bacterium]
LGFVTVLAFWHRFFARFPNASAADKIALQALYRLGQVAFLLASAFFLAMALASIAQSHHWLFFIYFAIELSEHFLFRWIDGNGKFFFQANASDCLGGAAGYAIRRFNNLAQ